MYIHLSSSLYYWPRVGTFCNVDNPKKLKNIHQLCSHTGYGHLNSLIFWQKHPCIVMLLLYNAWFLQSLHSHGILLPPVLNYPVWASEYRDKGRHLTQSYCKSPHTHRKIQIATWQHKNATKTSITQRLRTDLGRSVGVTKAIQQVR